MRLGTIYIKRKSWKDARTVFSKCCKEANSTTCWINLGLSYLKLGEMANAEDAIAQANILDNTNPKVWALNAILCMRFGKQRIAQARFALKNAISFGIKDAAYLEELGELFE